MSKMRSTLSPILLLVVAASASCENKASLTKAHEESAKLDQPAVEAKKIDKALPTASSAAKADSEPSPSALPKEPEAVGVAYQANGFPTRMPSTLSSVPQAKEWSDAPNVTTKELPKGCHMKFVREWLKVNCSKEKGTNPHHVMQLNHAQLGVEGKDFMTFETPGKVLELVIQTKAGRVGQRILFVMADGKAYSVGYEWPDGAPFPSTVFEESLSPT